VADSAVLRVRLTPRGGRDQVIRYESGVLHARVAAPPVDGAANKALVAMIADLLGIAKSAITFQAGETGRDKALRVAGIDAPTLESRIAAAVERSRSRGARS